MSKQYEPHRKHSPVSPEQWRWQQLPSLPKGIPFCSNFDLLWNDVRKFRTRAQRYKHYVGAKRLDLTVIVILSKKREYILWQLQ